MDATKAVELGFADDILSRNILNADPDEDDDEDEEDIDIEQKEKSEETADPDEDDEEKDKNDTPKASMLFSRKSYNKKLMKKISKHTVHDKGQPPVVPEIVEDEPQGRSVDELMGRLNLLKF